MFLCYSSLRTYLPSTFCKKHYMETYALEKSLKVETYYIEIDAHFLIILPNNRISFIKQDLEINIEKTLKLIRND
jgi:hypothetical protein